MLNASVKSAASILLVDDHPIVRFGLIQLLNLEPDLQVRWEASSVDEALALCKSIAPDMAIVDISLGAETGIDLIKKLTRWHASMQILAMSMHDESLYAERALRAGAKGYVMKHSASKNIVAALRRIREGDIHVSPEMRSRLIARAVGADPGKMTSGLDTLSDRELEVFRLIGLGLKKSELAFRLNLSVHTIESHRGSLKRKMNVNSSTDLARLAILHCDGDRNA